MFDSLLCGRSRSRKKKKHARYGKITIHPARSKAGDSIVLEALADARVAVAACSVSEDVCNGGRCTGLKIVVTK